MIAWPRIADVDRKTLGEVALELALSRVTARVREAGGNNRGPEIDEYARAVGLDPAGAFPWCTSGGFCVFEEAARQKGVANPFPRTAKAVEVFNRADERYRASNPTPGAIGVLDHGKALASELGAGKRLTDSGHIVFAMADLAGDVSANTNGGGSREGDRWAIKRWPDGGGPETVHGGLLVAWLDFSRVLT